MLPIWTTASFNHPNSTLWPTHERFNGTNVIFQGCNQVSIPLKIDSLTNSVHCLNPGGAITLTRKACGNTDQAFVDYDWTVGHLWSHWPMRLQCWSNFYDADMVKTFSIDRKLYNRELQRMTYVTVNPATVTVTPAATTTNYATTTTTTTTANTATSYTPSTSTQNTQTSNSNSPLPQQLSQLSQPPTTSSTQSTQPTVSPASTTSTTSLNEVKRMIVGIYNPSMGLRTSNCIHQSSARESGSCSPSIS